jgi:hypothetical protein
VGGGGGGGGGRGDDDERISEDSCNREGGGEAEGDVSRGAINERAVESELSSRTGSCSWLELAADGNCGTIEMMPRVRCCCWRGEENAVDESAGAAHEEWLMATLRRRGGAATGGGEEGREEEEEEEERDDVVVDARLLSMGMTDDDDDDGGVSCSLGDSKGSRRRLLDLDRAIGRMAPERRPPLRDGRGADVVALGAS